MTAMFDALKGVSNGGRIDILLSEIHPETGEAMPCTAHQGLVRAVDEAILGWSTDKASGAHAYAFTHAASSALLEYYMHRGLRRSRMRTQQVAEARLAEQALRLQQLRSACQQARQGDNSAIGRAVALAGAGHHHISDLKHAAAKFASCQHHERQLIEAFVPRHQKVCQTQSLRHASLQQRSRAETDY